MLKRGTKKIEMNTIGKEKRTDYNLNLILESMVEGVYIVSKDYEVEFMNKVLIDEFGDQVGGICYKVFHDREEPCPLCKNTEVMKGKAVRWEWHSRRNNRTYNLIEMPVRYVDGTVSKLTIFRDITRRRLKEDALKESEEKYHSLVESTEDSIYLVDTNCKYLFINSKYASRIGLPIDQIIGRAYGEFHSREEEQEFAENVKAACKTGKSVQYEHRSHRDGRCFLRTLSPVKAPDGRTIAVTVISKDITELKRTDEELRVSMQQLRETKDYLDNIIKSSADAIVVVDMEGIVRAWNKGAEDYMHYTADEVIGTSNKKFFADPEEPDRIMEIVLRDGELKNYRTTVINKDKKPVHISLSAALLRNKEGVPIGTVRVSRDITKEVELEEKIKEERDNLNLIFESMADGVYIVSKDYNVEFMNKVLIDEFGDQVGGICYKVFHNREAPCPLCKHSEVMQGETVRWEWHSRRKNRTYDLIETPMMNINGTLSKLTIFRDIHERKLIEEKLKEARKLIEEKLHVANERYKVIFEHALTAICVIEEDRTISLVNKEFETLSGYSREEIVGKRWSDFIAREDRETVRDYCAKRIKDRASAHCLFRFVSRNGEIKYVNACIVPFPGEKRCIASLLDITELKRKEDKLRETCEKLSELDKMKRDFLNVAYHEMRSPLAPIVGYASLLESRLPDRERKYVCNIESCARELEMMINRMLELARIESGKVELTLEEFSISNVVQEVVMKLEPEAKAKNLKISTLIPKIEIQADKQKIVAVFTNLINNAIKYTPEGGRIDIMVVDEEEDIRVCVADTGIGISKEHLPKIFERFYVSDTSLTRKTGCLGLGLSIVKGYVKLHGGRVWVTSELGKGSNFFFRIPKRQH